MESGGLGDLFGDPEELQRRLADFAMQMQGQQRLAWADNAIKLAVDMTVAAVNRVGHEGPPGGGLEFWGGSFVADPFGVVLAEASRTEEEILVVECDPQRTEEVRRNWPFLRDRRIDAYGGLTQRLLD